MKSREPLDTERIREKKERPRYRGAGGIVLRTDDIRVMEERLNVVLSSSSRNRLASYPFCNIIRLCEVLHFFLRYTTLRTFRTCRARDDVFGVG